MLEEPYEGIYQKFAYKETYVIKNGELKKIKVRTYAGRKSYQCSWDFLTSRQQQCTCKLSYSTNLASHKKMLMQYLPQKNKKYVKEKPEIFGNVSLETYKKKMVARNFKWIFSPEEKMSPEVMQSVVRAWVKRLESLSGHNFYWVAAIHQDTAHPHAHILLNGKDKHGKGFRFSKPLVQSGARTEAKELLTEVLGERSEELIKAANDRSLVAERFTELDEFIHKFEIPEIGEKRFPTYVSVTRNPTFQKRLDFLNDIGLAKYVNGKYFLEQNWMESLRNVGRYNTFLDARRFVRKDEGFKLKLFTEDTGSIKGTVKHFYRMDDENVWNNAYVIETEKGQGYYVPLFNPPNIFLIGKEVEIHLEKSQKGKLFPVVKRLDGGPSADELRIIKEKNDFSKKEEEMLMTF